jgi:D-alanyl-D-alanine carboxypeptidase/D-alanyl-D-alanine-endopeptidase (penicillin-binding protein 4)
MTGTASVARRAAAPAAATALLLGLAALTPAGAASSPSPTPPPPPTAVLAPVSRSGSAPSSAQSAALVARVRAALRVAPVGTDVAASVVDVSTGTQLLADGATRPQLPASTLKLLTAVAALHALGPDTRLTTKVVAGAAPGQIVLVGAGDATLTRASSSRTWPEGQAAKPASLNALAALTATALKKAGTTSAIVSVDDSMFSGPRTAPGWPASFVGEGVVAPVTALSVDQGRSGPGIGAGPRVADPSITAGKLFAARLTSAGITVTGPVARVTAATDAVLLASVRSATVADLVERMLTQSDDDLAEALAHLAGGALGGAASFSGGAAATERTMRDLGVTMTGAVLDDGSGLSGRDRLTTTTLVEALVALSAPALAAPIDGSTSTGPTGSGAATAGDPAVVAPLWAAVSGLPVAGVTGTLADRFAGPANASGRGVVRAKTGTLTGVNALAGIVRDTRGRLLAFAYVADTSPGPQELARAALDRAATALVP